MKEKSSTQLRNEIYLRNVARRWKSELDTEKKVYILFPYITSTTAENVLENVNWENCEIYTQYKIENFVNGSTCIKTLIKLVENGAKIYFLPNLHAKIVLISDTFVSIGSQNLTANGTQNKEATFTSTSLKTIEFIEEKLKKNWLLEGDRVNLERLKDIEKIIKPLIQNYSKLKVKFDEAIREIESERIKKEKDNQKQSDLIEFIENIEQTKTFVHGKVEKVGGFNWNSMKNNYRWTFKVTFGENLIYWNINNEILTLKDDHSRYLAIIKDTGKLSWTRVNNKSITYFGKVVISSIEIPVDNYNQNYEIKFKANWNQKTLPKYNLKIIISQKNIKEAEILAWFGINNIQFYKIKYYKLSSLKTWISENEVKLKALIIKELITNFKYEKRLYGPQADEYLEKNKDFQINLGKIDKLPLLIFKKIQYAIFIR